MPLANGLMVATSNFEDCGVAAEHTTANTKRNAKNCLGFMACSVATALLEQQVCSLQVSRVILVNMFTKNTPSKAPRRGRPSGTTEQGLAARRRLYNTAITLIGD